MASECIKGKITLHTSYIKIFVAMEDKFRKIKLIVSCKLTQ
jgi:hypothetical protein